MGDPASTYFRVIKNFLQKEMDRCEQVFFSHLYQLSDSETRVFLNNKLDLITVTSDLGLLHKGYL